MKNAIVIGASSGIGRELALQLSESGYRLCVTARRKEQLEELVSLLNGEAFFRQMDVSNAEESIALFSEITAILGTVDLVIISAGVGYLDAEMPWNNDYSTISVNVCGFTAIANAAYHLFAMQGYGHLAGISSVAAVRGGAAASYNASKAFVSSYLQGLRAKAAKEKLDICITDIRPGLVDTAMAQGEGLFWVASPVKAAEQIVTALRSRRKVAYVTRRWAIIAALLRIIPDNLYHRLV